MAHFLFVTWDGGGNVPPTTAIARELVSRGHSVRFVGHARQTASLEAQGFEVVRGRHARAFSALGASSPLTMMGVFGDRGMGRDMLDAVGARRTDLVVVDCLMFGALRAAHDAGLRFAVLEHLYDRYFREACLGGPLGFSLQLRGLRPRRALEAAVLRLILTLPELDPLPVGSPNVRQVGPTVEVAPRTDSDRTTILVSLSTFAFSGMQQALQKVIDATTGLGARVIVTTGPAIEPASLRLHPDVEAHAFVPHARLMPGAALFVGHGGHGSTMQALGHDLPMLLLPMGTLADQPYVAKSVVAAGAGIHLSKRASTSALTAALRTLLADGPHRAAAARLGAAVRAAPGTPRAADALEATLAGHRGNG